MDEKIKNVIEEYQCPGCVCGSNITCYEKGDSLECKKHVAGTTISHIGQIFLGLPKGFNRLGFADRTTISIFESLEDGWGYDHFNIPVWKHLDKLGNTLVRGICPRINMPWVHIFIGDWTSIIDCIEITQKHLDEMD